MCPRFSAARKPVSRSSAATTLSFVRAQPSITRVMVGRSLSTTARRGGSARTSSHRRPPAISAVFTTSAKPAASSWGGSVREHGGIGEHRGGLVERADVVLRLRQVHAGLASVGGVDLCHDRRRDVCDRDPALVGRCAEARQVPDHAASEGDDRVGALHARARQLPQEAFRLRHRLVLLTGRHGQSLGGGQAREPLAVEPPRALVGDDEAAPAIGEQLARRVHRSGPHATG